MLLGDLLDRLIGCCVDLLNFQGLQQVGDIDLIGPADFNQGKAADARRRGCGKLDQGCGAARRLHGQIDLLGSGAVFEGDILEGLLCIAYGKSVLLQARKALVKGPPHPGAEGL